jgi:predicted phosphodiesterase
MKILITADLHFRLHWFRWLIEQGANYDLVCISGDLLDMFKFESRTEQAREVSRWIRELAKATWVAVCSGNHDTAGRQISADRAPVYEWLAALGKEPKVITDGATQTVNDLIVTTVPYHCSKEQKSVWLDRGFTIRRQRGGPWLVLHHIPPIAYPGSTKEEGEAAELMIQYRPDYFVSGHSHQFPYFEGHSWAMRAGDVTVFAPGQLLGANFPNHIILDTSTKQVSWNAASMEWIAEEGLFDHLVLKFPPI